MLKTIARKVRMIIKNSSWGKHYRYFFVLLFTVYCLLSTASFADEIRARSVMVMDASTGEILYAKNPYLRHHPASTTKLMTAIIAVENTNFSDVVTISKNASCVSPHKAGFKEGDQVTVEQLLYAALLDSANDAAVALSEVVCGSEKRFVTLMNKKALDIGAVNTKFINSSGLPDPNQYTTAYDLAKIMNYVLQYQKLKEIIGTRVTEISTENGNSIFLRNTNMLLWTEEDIIGGKTGYTRIARHCFVCAVKRGNATVIVAILGSRSREGLWRESSILISKGFEVLGNKEKPFVYETKIHSDTADIRKASYGENIKIKVWSLKSKKGNKIVSQKTPKHKKTKLFTKERSKTKVLVKKKGKPYATNKRHEKKNLNIAEQSGPDRNKG
jgi:D-alanyl-D-alanine carboxypeptidase (penicillin-binding protein 5/6)